MLDSGRTESIGGVDVWRVNLEEHRPAFAHHWQHLDASERQRAAAFHNEADCLRCVISRGTLRTLLGGALRVAPDRVTFGYTEFGKPFLSAQRGLHFNTSHSGGWILHALSTVTPVGVDVEALRQEPFELAEFDQVLSGQERDRLLSLPPALRRLAFMDLWVCKEAYVKAIGQGLNRTLREICIGPIEHGGYALLDDRNPGGLSGPWTLAMIAVGPAHAACLGHPGPPLCLRIHDYLG